VIFSFKYFLCSFLFISHTRFFISFLFTCSTYFCSFSHSHLLLFVFLGVICVVFKFPSQHCKSPVLELFLNRNAQNSFIIYKNHNINNKIVLIVKEPIKNWGRAILINRLFGLLDEVKTLDF